MGEAGRLRAAPAAHRSLAPLHSALLLPLPVQVAPRGHPDCLTGKTFVVSGVLDSMTRGEAEDFIKRHGGKVRVCECACVSAWDREAALGAGRAGWSAKGVPGMCHRQGLLSESLARRGVGLGGWVLERRVSERHGRACSALRCLLRP